MLESFTTKQENRTRRVTKLLVGSLCAHGLALAFILFLDSLRVSAVPQPAAMVTFVDFASLPPPPPPPPPPKKRKSQPKQEIKDQPKPEPKIREFVAPKDIPSEKPVEPQEPEIADEGDENGVEGGVVGGVVGGVIGGVVEAPPPPPPPPPAAPVLQAMEIIKKRRIVGTEPEYPRMARAAGLEAVLMVKIFINPEGEVSEVQFLKTDKHFELAVRESIARWKFSPHMINGRPVGTYTVYKFVFRLD